MIGALIRHKRIQGSASIETKKRKLPFCWTPIRNLTLMLAPGANGVPSVMLFADRLEFHPPPFGCPPPPTSSVVPRTVIAHGIGLMPQVAASLIPATPMSGENIGRKSAFVGIA